MSTLKAVTDADFDSTVLGNGNPVVVDFWAEWCGPCRQIAPVLEELADEYTGKVDFVKLNADENQQAVIEYGVRGIPTLLVFSGGKVVTSIVGAYPKAAIKAKLADALPEVALNS